MKFRHLPSSGSYQKAIFAYVDVLGFSDSILRSANPQEILSLFHGIDFMVQAEFQVSIERRIVSDAVAIWSFDPRALFPIFNLCGLIQGSCLKQGYLVRGVIEFDDHYTSRIDVFDTVTQQRSESTDEIVISKALIRAAKREPSVEFPIIEVSPRASELIALNARMWPRFGQLYETTADGSIYIERFFSSHELSALQHKVEVWPGDKTGIRKVIEVATPQAITELTGLRARIAVGLSTTERPRQHWLYVANRFNAFVAEAIVVNQGRGEVIAALSGLPIEV